MYYHTLLLFVVCVCVSVVSGNWHQVLVFVQKALQRRSHLPGLAVYLFNRVRHSVLTIPRAIHLSLT